LGLEYRHETFGDRNTLRVSFLLLRRELRDSTTDFHLSFRKILQPRKRSLKQILSFLSLKISWVMDWKVKFWSVMKETAP
jgi:hypothetical protein